MKKLFTMLVATVCATMAYAQTDAISLNDVTIAKGGTQQVEVAINNAASKTAFQFDLALPTGVTVKEAKLNGTYGTSRHLEKGTVDGKMRFLSYDDANALLADGAKVLVTLEATTEAETANLTANGIVVVDPEAASVGDGQTASATITVSSDVTIEIPAGKKLAMVSARALDFTSLEAQGVSAYLCTGYEVESKTFWMTRVYDVPANTPIFVKGEPGTYEVPEGTGSTYYPQTFMLGNASAKFDVDKTEGYTNYAVSRSSGAIGSLSAASMDAGKAYFHVPSSVTTVAGEAQSFTMGAGKKLATVSDYDLDFTDVEGLKAYTVTGFSKDKSIWLSRVMKVSAKTPLVLIGSEASKTYEVPSTASQVAYVNMLKGNSSSDPVAVSPTMDGNTIYVLSLGSGKFGTLGKDASMTKGKAWLPVPTSFIPASTRGVDDMSFLVAETISLKAIGFGDDDNATGISRVAAEAGNDTWYNLNGQRIDTPTKKGLYIKNGKKVIVK